MENAKILIQNRVKIEKVDILLGIKAIHDLKYLIGQLSGIYHLKIDCSASE